MAPRWPELGFDELVSVGNEALVGCARRFDASRGVPFEGFAFKRVRGEMLAAAVKEVRGVRRLFSPLVRPVADQEPVPEAGPTMSQPSADGPEQARQRAVGWARREAVSMIAAALLGTPPAGAEQQLIAEQQRSFGNTALDQAIAELSDEQQQFVQLYYREEATLAQIAEHLGVSKRTAVRIHERIKTSLAQKLRKKGVTERPPVGSE